MSKAGLGSAIVFLLFGAAGLALAAMVRPLWLGVVGFLFMAISGSLIASRLFDRYATLEEKRRDLEDRVRNPD